MRHHRSDRNATQAIGRFARPSLAFLARTLIFAMVAVATSGVAHAMSQPAVADSDDAVRIVDSIVAGHADVADVPSDFVDELGYQPVSSEGTLINPNGGCSTPGATGPERFATACRTHDLGYDVLRYAEQEGVRLGAQARFELDRRLYADLLATCETPTCTATATAYFATVSANSIRQGYKAPHAEPAMPWVGLMLAVVALGAVTGLAPVRVVMNRARLTVRRFRISVARRPSFGGRRNRWCCRGEACGCWGFGRWSGRGQTGVKSIRITETPVPSANHVRSSWVDSEA